MRTDLSRAGGRSSLRGPHDLTCRAVSSEMMKMPSGENMSSGPQGAQGPQGAHAGAILPPTHPEHPETLTP